MHAHVQACACINPSCIQVVWYTRTCTCTHICVLYGEHGCTVQLYEHTLIRVRTCINHTHTQHNMHTTHTQHIQKWCEMVLNSFRQMLYTKTPSAHTRSHACVLNMFTPKTGTCTHVVSMRMFCASIMCG